MRISELILDGFKSYPVRTTITGWDPSFNAITGLNGSGKSNVLDAICFVLGITQMSSVRANNLMDLIYKRGQAGVTRASVTIVFDNTDRAKSPVGFEDVPQITVTRQISVGNVSKYLLNGHKSTLQALQSLFQSVQLNINNPTFCIMQGMITKVVNMKPQEVLSMIEEVAGTKAYEEKKDRALKQIAKREKHLEALRRDIREDIEPKLEKLREEKRSYLAYQKAQAELERLTRVVKAREWTLANERLAKAVAEVEAKQREIQACKKLIEREAKERQRMEDDAHEIQRKREAESKKGGKIAALAAKAEEAERHVVKLQTQVEIRRAAVEEEEKRALGARKALQELESGIQGKRNAHAADVASFASTKQAYETATAELERAEELLQSLITGLSADGSASDTKDGAGGYHGQLAEAEARASAAQTEGEGAKVQIGLLEKEIKEKEPRARKAAKEGEGLVGELAKVRGERDALRASVAKMDWDESRETTLLQRRSELQEQMSQLVEKRDVLRSRLAAVDFAYSDPQPNFDRGKVKGLVANLIDLPADRHNASTALEISAGGRLYNVVVEDEKVGSSLLERGQLRKRVTIIPLNKISAFRMSAEKLAAAQKAAPGKVDLALSLIGYPDEVSAAMAYVFGDTIIAADKEAAQKVTFNKNIGVKSVTLEGDVYDPSGTLSGGAAPSSSGIIIKIQELKQVEAQIAPLRAELDQIQRQLAEAKGAIDSFRKAKRQLDLKEHQVSLLEQQTQGSNAAKIMAEVEAAKTELAQLKEVIVATKQKQKQAADECKRLEKEMADFNNNKDSKLKEIKADIAKRKKQITKESGSVKERQRAIQTAELEIQQFDADCEAARTEVESADASVKRAGKDLQELLRTVEKAQRTQSEAELLLKEERAVLSAFDDELSELQEDIRAKKQSIADNELALKKADHELAQQAKDQSATKNTIESLEAQFTWIQTESKFFGQPNSPYSFHGLDLARAREQCRELESQQKGLGRKINSRVMSMIDTVEQKERELKKRLDEVETDKLKLLGGIGELDKSKREALITMWKKVDEAFGHIFEELLPSNFVKLVPPEGSDITQGLEIKVRLGSVWKASLTELSGGQRSLIALSLLLAIMEQNHGSLTILDEIDSALDLQHTAHMGSLFKNRFKGTQFIVVSLKEGLFTNANVLFKARFVDGTSVVDRIANRAFSDKAQVGGKEKRAERGTRQALATLSAQ